MVTNQQCSEDQAAAEDSRTFCCIFLSLFRFADDSEQEFCGALLGHPN